MIEPMQLQPLPTGPARIAITCTAGHSQIVDVGGYSRGWVEGFCFVLNKTFAEGSIKCCHPTGLMQEDVCGKPIQAKIQE